MQNHKQQKAQQPQAQAAPEGDTKPLKTELMVSLMRELFQTERSAQRHPRVEAERLHGRPPAQALEAVARHADAVLDELPIRAKHHDLPVSIAGLAVGSAFSQFRRQLADYFLDSEMSYRATLLGLRHGLDVLTALREAASAAGDTELVEWCERIYQARLPLIEGCARQLAWFAQHPEQALARSNSGLLGKFVESIRSQLGKLGMHTLLPGAPKSAH